MIPEQLIAEQSANQAAIQALANRDLVAIWRTMDRADPVRARNYLIGALRELTGAYGEIAAMAAADFYDEARVSTSSGRERFRASPASPAPVGQVDAMTRWGISPLFDGTADETVALTKIAGGMQRLIRQPARETVYRAVSRDPASPRYVRRPRGRETCDFCLMLASRSFGNTTYTSAVSAETVVGREVRRRGEIVGRTGRTRTSSGRAIGEAFHDDCDCEAVPVWSDDDVPEINRELSDEWDRYASAAPNPREAWREHLAATRN